MAKAPGRKGRGKPEGRGAKKSALKRKGKAGGSGKSRGRGKKASKGKGKGAAKGSGKGVKGSAPEAEKSKVQLGKKRAADGAEKAEVKDDDPKKSKKVKSLTPKKKKRKEVTSLYSDLISPGRTRKGDAIVSEILALLDSRGVSLSEYCGKEIGSRVVQACLKWGSRTQRREIFNVLKEQIPQLCTNRYAYMVVLKLLRYVAMTSTERKPTAEEKKAQSQVVKELLEKIHGKHLHGIFYHRQGCQVINGIYFSPIVSANQKRRLFHEVAIPRSVALLRPELPGSKPLRQLLRSEDLTAEQRLAMTDHLREAAEKAVDKELLAIDVVHLLFQAYTESCSDGHMKDLVEKCMAGAPYLLSSKAGAEALLRLLGFASAKHRRALFRDLKGKFAALAMNSVDYLVMMRLAETVDDTVLLGKTMLAEWTPEMEAICFDKYGHRVLAWILRPGDTKLFSPHELQCLALPAPSSVKAPETRRQELVRILRPLVRSVFLSDPLKVAGDVCAKEVLVAYLATDWDGELIEALLKACEQVAKEDECGSLGSGTATTTLLVLLKLEPAKANAPLALPLWRRCLQPALLKAATSRCAFVLLALLKQGGEARDAVLRELRSRRKEIATAVKAAEAKKAEVKGAKTLLAALDEADKKK